jgi:hypothetical protein
MVVVGRRQGRERAGGGRLKDRVVGRLFGWLGRGWEGGTGGGVVCVDHCGRGDERERFGEGGRLFDLGRGERIRAEDTIPIDKRDSSR